MKNISSPNPYRCYHCFQSSIWSTVTSCFAAIIRIFLSISTLNYLFLGSEMQYAHYSKFMIFHVGLIWLLTCIKHTNQPTFFCMTVSNLWCHLNRILIHMVIILQLLCKISINILREYFCITIF